MSIIMEKDDSVLSNRVVPFRLFLSNGTAPDTGASNDTLMFSQGGRPQQSMGSVSAISANAGMYYGVLSQSNISVLGPIAVWYDQGDFPQHVANVQVVNYNPFSNFSNIATKSYSGVTVEVNNLAGDFSSRATVAVGFIKAGNYSDVSVRIQAGDYGSHTTFGVSTIKPASYSGVSVGVLDIKPAAYSGVSVEVKTGGIQTASVGVGNYSGVSLGVLDIKPASYSGVTVGIDNIKPATYSGVTVGAGDIKPANYSGVSVGVLDIKPAAYSGVSVEVKTGGIQASSHGAGAVDAATLSTDAAQEIADRLLVRNIAGGADSGRSVGEAFMALRNRTQLSAVSYIVYQNDDTAIAWHASLATTSDTIRVTDADPA